MDTDFTQAVAIVAGRGGWTLYMRPTPTAPISGGGSSYSCRRISGYSFDQDATAVAAVAAGVPAIDSRSCPLADVARLVTAGPLLAVGAPCERGAPVPGTGLDDCGYGPLDHAPLELFARLYARRGARLMNFDEQALPEGSLAV